MSVKRKRKAEIEVYIWNRKYPIGTPVEVILDNGEKMSTFTRAGASVVGCLPVIWLEGIAGCYLLSRVRAIAEKVQFFEAVYADETMTPEMKIFWLYKSCQHLNQLLSEKEGSMDGFIEGRIVHFVMPDGEHRPAVVVHVWRPESPERKGYCNLQVFTDGSNDGPGNEKGIRWETSVLFSEAWEPRTWHWIERER